MNLHEFNILFITYFDANVFVMSKKVSIEDYVIIFLYIFFKGVSSDEEQGEDVTSRSPKSPQGPAEFITDTTVDKTLNKDTEMIVDNVPTSEIMDVAESLPEGETDNVNNSMATLPSTSAEKTAMMDLYSSPDYKII